MVLSKDMQPIQSFGKLFWHNQFRVKIELPTEQKFGSLKDKVAIVTGSNSGLGFEASRQLLALGLSHLIVAVRSLEKGKEAASKLRTANSEAIIDVWLLDMESYDSIQAFTRKCDLELPRIDYVVLNAGLSAISCRKVPSTGHETTIQVNHLSTALLTVLLLPVLKAKSIDTSTPRLTVVNSVTAHMAKFPNRDKRPLLDSFDDINLTLWNSMDHYAVTKLLNQFFLIQLAEKVNPDHVIIAMVEPGLTKGTNLGGEARGMARVLTSAFFNFAGRTVDRAAATYVDALLGHGKEVHGSFLLNCEPAP